jgi:hypothetical protein
VYHQTEEVFLNRKAPITVEDDTSDDEDAHERLAKVQGDIQRMQRKAAGESVSDEEEDYSEDEE